MNETFQKIDSQIESISLSASTVQSMQHGIHGVVAKQQQDMEGMKVDIERYLANAMATIASSAQSSQGHVDQQGQALRGG